MRIALLTVIITAALSIPSAGAAPTNKVTLDILLREMADRSAQARFASPSFRLKQASSFDRQSNDPANRETWHANADFGQFLHTEVNEGRREWVIMQDDGPGAIVRFWIPLLGEKDSQTIRFYLDGSRRPAITAKINDLLSGRAFVKPPFAFTAWDDTDIRRQRDADFKPMRGVAGDLYLPIPYAKGCKITLDSASFYYVINYRSYEPGTRVETFTMEALLQAQKTVEHVGDALCDTPSVRLGPSKTASIAPGEEIRIDLPRGAGAVDALRVKVDAANNPAALRSVVLQAEFDSEQTVWCPVGDLFGTGVRLNPVRDARRVVAPDGTLTGYWVMPFRTSGAISLKNVGSKPASVSLAVSTTRWRWDDRSLHFHAKWRGELGMKTRPYSDWNYVEIAGRGCYFGDTLTVYSPARAWYGEGDERVYLDGATFPAHIGTGTEDYYGYAWGMATHFGSPFISMPKRDRTDRGDWRGYTTTSRLRILDTVPFTTGLKVDMEVWNWADTQVDYGVASFWYARPGATDNRPPQPLEAAAPIKEVPGNRTIPGAIEFEGLQIMGRSQGLETQVQDAGLTEGEWSGEKQLFAMARAPGSFIELTLPVPDDRPRSIALYGTKSHDYGILRFTVNGRVAAKEFDGYSPQAVASGPIELGRFTPENGKLVLRIEVVGVNPAAKGPRFYFGLDCVVLTP